MLESKLVLALVALIGSGVGWYFKAKVEEHSKREDSLRKERAQIYIGTDLTQNEYC